MFVRTRTRNRMFAGFIGVSKFALLCSLVAHTAPATASVPSVLVVDDFTTSPVSFDLNGTRQRGPLAPSLAQSGSQILGRWRGTSLSLTLANNTFSPNRERADHAEDGVSARRCGLQRRVSRG